MAKKSSSRHRQAAQECPGRSFRYGWNEKRTLNAAGRETRATENEPANVSSSASTSQSKTRHYPVSASKRTEEYKQLKYTSNN